jgi:hypothetical protein
VKSEEPSDRIRFIPYDAEAVTPVRIADLVYDNFRSYRRDHCAIFTNSEDVKSLTSMAVLPSAPLQYTENFHWTGRDKGLRKERIKRIVVGDYLDWFYWYMKWHRLDAFQILVLVRPFTRMLEDGDRGFYDGLLTRLMQRSRVNRVLMIEEERFKPIIEAWVSDDPSARASDSSVSFGSDQLTQSALATLAGSTISWKVFLESVRRTLSYKLIPNSEQLLLKLDSSRWFIDKPHRWFRVLSEEGKMAIQSMSLPGSYDEMPTKKQFEMATKKRHARSDEKWLRSLVEKYLQKTSWFTNREFYDYVNIEIQEALRSETPPTFIDPDIIGSELDRRTYVFLPSEPVLRHLLHKMTDEGILGTRRWAKEIGRPAEIFFEKDSPLAFKEGFQCGQCAFYVSVSRQCRLWHLLGKAYGPHDSRWTTGGAQPLDKFELYKMKNAWRISPRSDACINFLDKKKDYTRKEVPDVCDICGEPLPGLIMGRRLVCANCKTRYTKFTTTVRVGPAYENKFRETYRLLAGKDPEEDITRLREERPSGGNTYRHLEKLDYEKHHLNQSENVIIQSDSDQPITIMLFPDDRILVKKDEAKLTLLGRRKIVIANLAGTIIIDHARLSDEDSRLLQGYGVIIKSVVEPEVVKNLPPIEYYLEYYVNEARKRSPAYGRSLTAAMIASTINATERLGNIAGIQSSLMEAAVQEQQRILRRLERVPDSFTNYEALTMKEYWKVFKTAVESRGQYFGPRVRSRFVRDYVDEPNGRSRGYTTVDAGVNHLHHRRLIKTILTNNREGISTAGEGFIHVRILKERRHGLLLDIIDPQKLADREKLVEHIVKFDVNWRDFHTASDRHGRNFYYPRMEIISTLEKVSDEADAIMVSYRGQRLKLTEAYAQSITNLAAFLTGRTDSFVPFAFVN